MKLTNEKLYELCKKYGAAARLWRQKFIGLLPEVNRRRLYEEKGFTSIFEFAAKLCGLSAEQVRLALNLEKRFEDKPILKKMLEEGEASINKLSRIVSIATAENEEELAEKIRVLPKSALDTFVRDVKGVEIETAEDSDGSQEPLLEAKGLPGQTSGRTQDVTILTFQIADDIAAEFNELHSKGIDVNELLRKMLERRKEEIAQAKEQIGETIEPTKSRYIPVQIKKILNEEYGEKCSITTCIKPAEETHHSQRFSLSQNHDPRFLAPLCHDHHIIAHSIDIKYHQARAYVSSVT
ncbi:MAG: hypothetical protein AAB588_05965 [Patescibacteria group bacterium]